MSVSFTILLALLISLFPWGSWGACLSQQAIAIVVLYWLFRKPSKIGIYGAGIVGLSVDVFKGSLLGSNAMVFGSMAALVHLCRQRLDCSLLWVQGILVILIGAWNAVFTWGIHRVMG